MSIPSSELFYTALDMLTTLIHSTLVTDNERDENKKLYTNLMKKLRKELADKNNSTIRLVRQLLPHAKAACTNTCEVIACEPVGSLMDTKGLRVTEKEKVSMWDLLEGHKNPAPLLWSWFGAVKMERKPLSYEENHRLLKYHTHSLAKPTSYYYEPLPLPPEDAEEEPSKDSHRDDKADTPSSVESPAAPGTTKRKGQKRPRKPKAAVTPTQTNPMQQQIPNHGISPMMQQQQIPNQMMNPQMGQQFNPNQPQQMNNMNMMQNNMMMNNQMNMGGMGQNMNQMQMNQMGQNNPNMGQMNMQYQQQTMNQMGQMNMNQQNMNMNMNINQMGQQNQQWNNYNQIQQQQPQQQAPQNNQQFYNQNVQMGAQANMAPTPQSKYFYPNRITSLKLALISNS
jgi:mediator of RNA polymerase II transcription subunit 12